MSSAAIVADVRADASAPAQTVCAHCGQLAPSGERFCCAGCAAAFVAIQQLGLGRYYAQRILDPRLRAPRPDAEPHQDVARNAATHADGSHELSFAIDGLQCGACVWLIESVLARQPDVIQGRVNMTTRRLKLVWRGTRERADQLVATVERLGYRLVPFNAAALTAAQDQSGRALLRALAVAGFAAGNVMLLSIGIWASEVSGLLHDMGPATRDLLHWISALIAMPAVAYAGMPFFTSASMALRHGRTNMDVPISLGVILVTGLSLAQTIQGGTHAYFDSAITLLFFLLIGRVLDHRARGQARGAAEQLLMLQTAEVGVLQPDGSVQRRGQQAVAVGDRILVGPGERIGVDGLVERGSSMLDASLVTGESMPEPARIGSRVFAGTLNLGEALVVRTIAIGAGTLLAECVRLIEAAEARRSRFVVIADRVARRYAPAVHLCALLTFLWWYFVAGAAVGDALLIACAVLIITCPCALALAVPVVQVIATSGLLRRGVLLKSPTALERLAEVDTVVFDKTGTLTEPALSLVPSPEIDRAALQVAASIAASSRHPLARSLVAAADPAVPADNVIEHRGLGLSAGNIRLGSRAFIAGSDAELPPACGPELWLDRPGAVPVRFAFAETPRPDAAATVRRLRGMGLAVQLLSGDRREVVEPLAARLGIIEFRAQCSPVEKVAQVEALVAAGRRVLMVGDGLNDAPALAAATISASPATAADVSQTVADIVFQGHNLDPLAASIAVAGRARSVMCQNLALSIGYNALMVPLAVGGYVTPWLAAAAMSSSSLLVMLNSLRLRAGVAA